MKTIVKMLAVITLLIPVSLGVKAQEKKADKKAAKQAAIKQKVDDQNYTLWAQIAIPQGGGSRNLYTDDYDLKVKSDSLIAWLPYFGQVYFDAPINPEDAGLKFTSTKFTYVKKPWKKDGWQIAITPKDVKNLHQIFIYISADGYSTMSFNFVNRSQITFDSEMKD